jgi:hypothetical protein
MKGLHPGKYSVQRKNASAVLEVVYPIKVCRGAELTCVDGQAAMNGHWKCIKALSRLHASVSEANNEVCSTKAGEFLKSLSLTVTLGKRSGENTNGCGNQ